MKILLINPPIYDFSAYDVWLKPLGLLYLSNILKANGFEVILLDCTDRNFFSHIKTKEDGTGKLLYEVVKKPEILENIPLNYKRYGAKIQDIENFLSSNKDVDYVVITSSITYWYYGIKEIVELTKSIISNAKILLGGNYPTLSTQHAINLFSSKVNKIFFNPGFLELLEYLGIKNVKKYENFTNYPPPDYSLYKKVWYVVVRFSYGCFYNCEYCASKILNKKYVQKDIKQFTEEIKYLYYTTNCKNFVFYDDALFNHYNIKIIKKFLKEIIKLNLNLKFFTPNGINPKFVDKELATLMKETNFQEPRLSLETISDITHLFVDKKITLKEFESGLENLLTSGYKPNEISVYILAGLPYENIEDVYKSINYLSKYNIRIRLCEMSPVPKTKFFYRLGLKEDIDPLLLNNSIFLFNGIKGKIKPWCSYKEFLELKKYVQNLNNDIKQ